MSNARGLDVPPDPGTPAGARPGPGASRPGRLLLKVLVILLGSGLTGLAGGIAWARLAPVPTYQVAGKDLAYVVNPETSAFIVGDAWYCLIGAIGGVIIGLGGFVLAVRRHGPVPMVAILAGSVGAAFAARWVGQSWGLARFNAELAANHAGALLHAPLVLGAAGSAILWPAIVFWPLGASVAAGALMLIFTRREPAAARSPAEAGAAARTWPLPPEPGS